MKKGEVFIKGLMTGLVLQLAVGPVFIFIVNIAMQGSLAGAFSAVLAVTIVDYLYITLAILGIGKLLEDKGRKRVLTVASSAVLIVFGFLMIRKGISFFYTECISTEVNLSIAGSFASAFILTASSPLTIVFWSGVFTSKAIEYSLVRRELVIFGLSAGLATFIFLGISAIILSFLKVLVPAVLIQALNILAGVVLTGYGVLRIRHFKYEKRSV